MKEGSMREAIKSGKVWVRLVLCFLILLIGVLGFVVLKNQKKPPVQSEAVERPLAVEAVRVEPTSLTVELTGYGELRSKTVVPLSAEVAGRVTSVHPRLEPGEIIAGGEVLLTIDERDFRLNYETASARLQTLKRDQELAVKEFERVRSLYEKNKVGTLSAVEKAETAANAIKDRIRQVEQEMNQAELRLERCTIRAPFDSRVTEVSIEQGEYVSPGKKILTLADDAGLEVYVSLDSRDVQKWLAFDAGQSASSANWFARLAPVPTQIIWTENDQVTEQGVIDRVVRFDPGTRTVQVAVRLERSSERVFPLVAGMFCRVVIPGRKLERVYVLPRHAVTFENTVYVAKDDRLQTRQVKVVRFEQDRAIVAEGLSPGEIVLTTRLEQPLENALLTVTVAGSTEK